MTVMPPVSRQRAAAKKPMWIIVLLCLVCVVLIGAYVYPPHHYSQCYLSAGCGGCTGSGEGASPAPIRPPPALEAGADGGGWTRQNGSKDTRSAVGNGGGVGVSQGWPGSGAGPAKSCRATDFDNTGTATASMTGFKTPRWA